MNQKNDLIFFGSSDFSVGVLNELKARGFLPALLVTTADKPKGRGLSLAAGPVKIWAATNAISCLQPLRLDQSLGSEFRKYRQPIFLVASYGKIIPKKILDISANGFLNIHPSLLPKYRGPSPIQTAILNDDRKVGVSIMRIDEQVDHGPVLASKAVNLATFGLLWPPKVSELKGVLAKVGVELLLEILPAWLAKKVGGLPQNDAVATKTEKIKKTDGLIDLTGDSYGNYLKIQAMSGWPNAYFFAEKSGRKVRMAVKEARFKDGRLEILRVVPEGKPEMAYQDFLRGLRH
jgi:methionyl-tRNA formyltransferase